ncbi:hypothetical protein BSL78_18050 [Apostichopus japonicus]|uniref:Receptor ligand binding region domain-containing protein n=1 Tax=Stichopus japonicus TaxID=307972 RepID=A0A2G8KAN6_STIJA|nr:hypothetical protein BSL78_18050 [Apostichopus japonicus]
MLGALDAGYLDGYHVFITVDVVDDAYIGANTFMGDDGRDDEANMAFDALFNVHIRKPKTELYAEFERKVREKTALPPFNNHIDDNTEVDVHAGPLFDAVLMYANALQKTLDEGYTIEDGLRIAQNMRDLNFEGIDRMVYIDENGDRNPDYSLQDHIDYDFHDFAHYEEATGNLSIITPPRWPSGLATPQETPQCGWDGEFCEVNPYVSSFLS